MSVALSGRQDPHSSQLEGFLNFAKDHQLELDQLWEAQSGHRRLAAMIMRCPGRTAALYLSPIARRADIALAAQLGQQACDGIKPGSISFIQAALDLETTPSPTAEALGHVGFKHLANLTYMSRCLPSPPDPIQAPADMTLVSWSPQQSDLFCHAILDSYLYTRDCPDLVGLRQIDDVIEGHMACRQFEPQLWLALHHQSNPVGVMLMNLSNIAGSAELVYLGLGPQWRGRGLARYLMRYGFWLAYHRGIRSITLAVDEQNESAVGLYRSMQFTPYARKTALIKVLPT